MTDDAATGIEQVVERLSAAVAAIGTTASVAVYGNLERSRDTDVWVEGDAGTARELAIKMGVGSGPLDLAGPWCAPDDGEWIAAARWNAARGLHVAGPVILAPPWMCHDRCVAAYQRRFLHAAEAAEDRARCLMRVDPSSARSLATSSLRMWLKASTKCAPEWRTVNRLTDPQVRAVAADVLGVPGGCGALTMAGIATGFGPVDVAGRLGGFLELV